MEIALVITILSTVLSIAAFVISVVALWQTHFAKFRAITTCGTLQIRIYPIRSKNNKWYLPSVDIPISITNEGARAGKVMGLRIRTNFPDLPIPNNYEIFQPEWEIDHKIFEPISGNRFEWIEKAVIADWMPFVVLPKQTITKHLIFESKWDEPVIQENISFELEINTDTDKKWRSIAKWHFVLSAPMWSELTNNGAAIACYEANTQSLLFKESINPSDLHKYTGSKVPIPKNGFGPSHPSYLDYGTNKSSKKRKNA